ncbi:hypothetical protein [Pseudonocardia sp.]|uniref:hypothetical protein n=1 Tax=Pseudonocardia sp. TaxID=60912 RepID=UPI003D09886E
MKKRVRVSALLLARLGYCVGLAFGGVGVFLLWGLAVGLVVVGVVVAASCLLLVETGSEDRTRGSGSW